MWELIVSLRSTLSLREVGCSSITSSVESLADVPVVVEINQILVFDKLGHLFDFSLPRFQHQNLLLLCWLQVSLNVWTISPFSFINYNICDGK